MKNVLLLLLVAACVYQYMNPRVEVQIKEVRVAVAAPFRPSGPRLYYHSPLDAPAMPVNMSTGTGYFSTDPLSRFKSPLLTSASGAPRQSGGYVPPPTITPAPDPANPLQGVEILQSKLNEQP